MIEKRKFNEKGSNIKCFQHSVCFRFGERERFDEADTDDVIEKWRNKSGNRNG